MPQRTQLNAAASSFDDVLLLHYAELFMTAALILKSKRATRSPEAPVWKCNYRYYPTTPRRAKFECQYGAEKRRSLAGPTPKRIISALLFWYFLHYSVATRSRMVFSGTKNSKFPQNGFKLKKIIAKV
jgi:hypothetical protein